MARLLITGGAGFIGSHTCVVLLEAGHELVVLDNFDNSSPEALQRVAELGGGPVHIIEGDIRDEIILNKLFEEAKASTQPIDAVIHFAGLKAVGESVANPLHYWDVNVVGSHQLLGAMEANNCRTLVFSSTSTIYGEPTAFPLVESMPPDPIHPYAQSKLAVEHMLAALSHTPPGELQRCAISTPWVLIPAVASEKTHLDFRATFSPSSHKSPAAAATS